MSKDSNKVRIVNSREFARCFNLPNPDLRTYFGRVENGQPNVYDTPFARGESTEDLLSTWNATLVSIRDKWPSLYEYESDMAQKVGPMSVMKPLNERLDDIDAYYEGILLPQQPLKLEAVDLVCREFAGMRGLRLRSQTKTIDIMKKSTNSGSPFFTRRRNVLKAFDAFNAWIDSPRVVGLCINNSSNALFDSDLCAVLGWRGQEGGPSIEDVKQRVVWMFPLAVNVLELQWYQPFIESAQHLGLVPAWINFDQVDRVITRLFDTKASKDLVVCTDFSKFDQHFNRQLQDAAMKVYKYIGCKDFAVESWLTGVFPMKYMMPLAYDWGKVRFGPHGMGSGSGGTNCDETVAHRALQHEVALMHKAKLNPNSQCLGDDGVLSYPGITVEDVVDAYTSHGLEMNVSKQYASTHDCVYLRRWHHSDYRVGDICVGVYSTNRALGRLRYLENYQDPKWWGPKAVALRQLSIIENVKYHPLRTQFAEFCMKRDKYRLGIDIPGFLDNIRSVAMEHVEHMPDFLGYVQTLGTTDPVAGIENWWIVQFLKSYR
uniref:RNA-dependent RNA polymerase n=1 Tax=Rabbit picobirnavirus 1 TaxID=2716675 RepID=A0A6G7PSQ2_9VIRU|nr:RNA-dependent RNA polymerase [Rabbit picobirnavirus 1]